ncbi:hypothetical protein NM688_g981 [Phlebia brevispora]|uniref:Uncharacterized protein n=1 Tax=Phlebia brevispora TaxID=194682 RepID=A0ACC1TCU1_9APHY|nr:hypothetical protein NM688_g981 [Phlebia brevispora]
MQDTRGSLVSRQKQVALGVAWSELWNTSAELGTKEAFNPNKPKSCLRLRQIAYIVLRPLSSPHNPGSACLTTFSKEGPDITSSPNTAPCLDWERRAVEDAFLNVAWVTLHPIHAFPKPPNILLTALLSVVKFLLRLYPLLQVSAQPPTCIALDAFATINAHGLIADMNALGPTRVVGTHSQQNQEKQ